MNLLVHKFERVRTLHITLDLSAPEPASRKHDRVYHARASELIGRLCLLTCSWTKLKKISISLRTPGKQHMTITSIDMFPPIFWPTVLINPGVQMRFEGVSSIDAHRQLQRIEGDGSPEQLSWMNPGIQSTPERVLEMRRGFDVTRELLFHPSRSPPTAPLYFPQIIRSWLPRDNQVESFRWLVAQLFSLIAEVDTVEIARNSARWKPLKVAE